MTLLFRALSMIAVLAAAPAFAAAPPPAPQSITKAPAQDGAVNPSDIQPVSPSQNCPAMNGQAMSARMAGHMASGQMMSGQMMGGQTAPGANGAYGPMMGGGRQAMGGAMMGSGGTQCPHGPPAAAAPGTGQTGDAQKSQ